MPKQTTDNHRAAYMPLRCNHDAYDAITKIAHTQKIAQAEALRRVVDAGLVALGYKQDEDALRDMIQTAVQETMKPQVERLAAISAKATQLSGAAFFMEVYMGRLLLPEGSQSLIDEAAGRARQLGIEYLKLKDRDIDAFIRTGTEKMADT